MKNFNNYFTSVLTFCLVYCALTCKNTSKEIKRPLLFVLKDSINLGNIRLKDSAIISWSLVNNGTAPLKIRSSGSSCGCSKVYLKDSVIAPLDSITLLVKYYSTDTGFFKKHIVVETNAEPIYKTLLFYGYHPGT